MDMNGLIAKTPGLLDALKSLGLSTDQVVRISAEWTRQLRQGDERDISDLLRELDGNDFVSRINLDVLARASAVEKKTVREATCLVGKVISGFSGEKQSLLGSLRQMGRTL
jgi:hypothetical protein